MCRNVSSLMSSRSQNCSYLFVFHYAVLSSVSVSSDGLSKSKAIIKERCKYFPLCRQGDSCEFLHPSTNCKAFPACKFGDKCLYLHPMCKYDKTCHRLDCNYMHTKPLAGHVSSAPPLGEYILENSFDMDTYNQQVP